MRNGSRVGVVIPALNEEASIGGVLDAIPDWVDQIVVADNGSTDSTPRIAAERGADVVHESERGYGAACQRGIATLAPCDVVVFVDADLSDYPNQMHRLVDPIAGGAADFVVGSRRLGNVQRGALTVPQRFGNRLACRLIRVFWGVRHTDLGPFRAIRASTLRALGMRDRAYGWTVEMQVKSASRGVRTLEVPVDYRKRRGRSKISGTVRGVIGAGVTILSVIFVAALLERLRKPVRRLIVFTRYPRSGTTKTRMIPALGEEGAADLHRAMAEHCLRNARSLMGIEIEVRYTGGTADETREWLGADLRYADQGSGDLGLRMRRAFECAFAEGATQVVVVGTDCPDLSPAVLQSAFDGLARPSLVLGPASDGGYYLIGLHSRAARRALSAVFEGIAWSTEHVYSQTVERAKRARLRLNRLVPLHDVDRPDDLRIWEQVGGGVERTPLSVIIPVLNEATTLPKTLAAVYRSAGIEVIVVDGGSSDDSVAVARAAGALVLETCRGRAAQMNAGAASASGEALLFLHADTIVPPDYVEEVSTTLSRTGVVLGAFRFSVDDPRLSLQIVARATNWRARWRQMPYGDQGLFIRRETFRALGGFPDLPIMEDYAFVRKARKAGRIRISRASAPTSARRWRRLGPWKTTAINQLVIGGYWIGLSASTLARFYREAGR